MEFRIDDSKINKLKSLLRKEKKSLFILWLIEKIALIQHEIRISLGGCFINNSGIPIGFDIQFVHGLFEQGKGAFEASHRIPESLLRHRQGVGFGLGI